jgi:hypothetical protein
VKYVAFDYEEPGVDNFWHIFTLDNDKRDSLCGMGTLLYIKGPDTPEMMIAVEKIAQAIEDAVTLAESLNAP